MQMPFGAAVPACVRICGRPALNKTGGDRMRLQDELRQARDQRSIYSRRAALHDHPGAQKCGVLTNKTPKAYTTVTNRAECSRRWIAPSAHQMGPHHRPPAWGALLFRRRSQS
jgi:hypothetical protein